MAKLAHQNSPPPVDAGDVATKDYADSLAGNDIEIINIVNRATHDSDTAQIVGAVSFAADDYDRAGMNRTILFRAVAAFGDVVNSGVVTLRDVTNSQDIVSLAVPSTTLTKYESVALVAGAGVGEIKLVDTLYEVSIKLAAPSGGPTETIEVYSAEVRFEFSVP